MAALTDPHEPGRRHHLREVPQDPRGLPDRGGLQPHHRSLQGEPGQGWRTRRPTSSCALAASPCSTSPRMATETGMWNKKTRQWEVLPQEYRSAVEQGPSHREEAGAALIKLPVQNCGESIMKGIKLAIASLIAGATLVTLPVTAAENRWISTPCSIRSRPPAPANPSSTRSGKPASWLTRTNKRALLAKAKADLAAEVARAKAQGHLRCQRQAAHRADRNPAPALRQHGRDVWRAAPVRRRVQGSSMPPPAGSSIPSRPPC